MTFIAPKINISASHYTLTAYQNGVLFYATTGDIHQSGSDVTATGIFYAPNGEIQIPGSSNVVGFVVADTIHVSGSGLNLTATGPLVAAGLVKLIG